jgi:hypothetical protein
MRSKAASCRGIVDAAPCPLRARSMDSEMLISMAHCLTRASHSGVVAL